MFWLPPLVRALSTALLVVVASAMAEALGPFWGALISGLPVSSGPAYVFLALQHDDRFIAASALASLAANAATGVFLILYARLSRHAGLWPSLGTALIAWCAAAFAIRAIGWSPLTALLLNAAVYGAGFSILNPASMALAGRSAPGGVGRRPRRRMELVWRAAAVAGFVTLVVAASSVLGPAATGMIAVFPVSLISVIVILHPRAGAQATALLAANALRAMLGFGAMLFALRLAVPPFGTPLALAIALSVSAAWSVGLLAVHRLRAARRQPA
jgi:MFS family permease